MRALLFLHIALFTLSSCDSEIKLSNTLWIGDHSGDLSYSDDYNAKNNYLPIRKVLAFSEDSMKVWHSSVENLQDDLFIHDKHYSSIDNFIILEDSLGLDTLSIEIFGKDSLILVSETENRRLVYQTLPKTNQAKSIDKLVDLMTNKLFTNDHISTIEFKKNRKIITPSLWDETNRLWIVDTFRNELFLTIGGFSGTLFQVNKIDNNGFTVHRFFQNDQEFRFETKPNAKKYKTHLLEGQWERIYKTNPPEGLGTIKSSNPYHPKERLKIFAENLIRYDGFQIDSLQIEASLQNDIIYVSRAGHNKLFNQWNINELTESKMEMIRLNEFDKSIIDTIQYQRI